MENPSLVLVALGANLPSEVGDPAATLRAALRIMHLSPDIAIRALTNFWTSPAHPAGSGPDYCNAAALAATTLAPDAFLAALHGIEAEFGRDRANGRWQSRPLDLDLIAWNNLVLPDSETQDRWRTLAADAQIHATPDQLILPHPRMQDRGFVLAPLAQIAPGWRHPRTGLTVTAMLAALPAENLHNMQIHRPASCTAAS